MSSSRSSSPISAFKAAGCDLLVGEINYDCGHCFHTMLDYSLMRTGDRSSESHQCPKCAQEDGTCLVCLQPWNASVSDACPSCDAFFETSVLLGRIERLDAMGVSMRDDRPLFFNSVRNREMQLRERRRQILWNKGTQGQKRKRCESSEEDKVMR
ncbi:hypothetical protein KJ359_005529 [Pestalotiopsis sp. 9143b]|nr:hypothetical protein KJ359_005529 [Pestalotiopsis sp. 9143b]